MPKIDTVFTLDQPFMAVRLKFQINDGVISPSGRLCWHLTLFGCSQEDGMQSSSVHHQLWLEKFDLLVFAQLHTCKCFGAIN